MPQESITRAARPAGRCFRPVVGATLTEVYYAGAAAELYQARVAKHEGRLTDIPWMIRWARSYSKEARRVQR